MPTQTEQFTIPLFGFKTPLINFKKVLFPLPIFPIIIHKPDALIEKLHFDIIFCLSPGHEKETLLKVTRGMLLRGTSLNDFIALNV